MIKLVAIDMDATLLKDDKTYDRQTFNRLIQALYEKGVRLAIASGNSFDKLDQYIDEVIKPGLYFAGDNGNHIVKDGQTLTVKAISKRDVVRIVKALRELGGYHPIVSTTQLSYMLPSRQGVGEYFSLYNPTIKVLDSFEDLPQDESIVKLAVMADHPLAIIKQTVAYINQNFPSVTAVTSGELWMDVYHLDGGKGAAIQYLQTKYSISPNETMAFGDSLNDYTMMQAASYSMAMGNADPDLKAVCQYQIGTNNESGVIKVLQDLLLNDNLEFLEDYRIQ